MAYSPSDKYPGAVDTDPNYQGGKFRDNNPSTTNNGSPLKAIDRNELLARDEAIMNDAGFEYNGLPDTPQNSQLFKAYKASLGNGANLLSNHNFIIQSPDGSQPSPDATPRDYPPGFQIFSGVFANETTGITNLTCIDGHVSFSGGDFYMPVTNTGAIARLNSNQLVASVADFDGKPRTRGVSFALVGDEYRVTVGVDALEDTLANPTPLGSVKFEQGASSTNHETRSLSLDNLSDYASINYKDSGVNSAVQNMIAGAKVGEVCSAKGSIFERMSDSSGDISDFKRLSQDAFYKYGTFALGASITKSDQALLHSDGFYYAYHGSLSSPILVAPGDSPETLPNGNWSCVGLLNGYPINNAFNYGITENATYVPQQAWENRTAIQLMCQNMFFSEFDIDGRGNTLWMLSTVHPLRSNITVRINAGCKMRGRYNDPSIPQSLISQSGGMIGMVLYADPDNNDFTVVGTIINATVVLDGDVSTEFSATHNRPHSNLCIGFFKARNCKITGGGGVSESDHKGLNFDGDCQDCEIDVAYVRGTSNQPLNMKGDPTKTFSVNKVKCNSVSEIKFDGGQPFDVVFSRDNAIIEIEIGSYQWNGVDKGQLVSSGGDGVCDVRFGRVLGLNQIVRHSDTDFVNISGFGEKGGSFEFCDNICTRVDANPNILKDVTINGLRAMDALVSVFKSENRVSNFRRLTISNNDFEEAGSTMQTFALEFGDNNATTTNCFENINPAGFTPQYPNKINKESGSLITGTPTTFTWDYTDPDWNYSFVAMLIDDGVNGASQGVMSIEARRLTSIDTTFNVAGIPVTVQRSGTVFTFTASAGTFLLVRAHN